MDTPPVETAFLRRLLRSRPFKTVLAKYRRAQAHPHQAQQELLLHIVHRNRNTAYGRKHGFSTIKSIEDYQQQVPVVTYEDLRPYVDCMLQGMKNVLVKDKTVFFATTSGSTNKPKLIPVTNHRKRQLQQELLLWAFAASNEARRAARGKTLYFAGPYREGISIGGTLMGSISGYMASQSPSWAKTRLVIPPEYYNEMDYEKKTRMIALKALCAKNITQIGFAAPVEAILFLDYLQKHRKSLIKGVERMGKKARARQLAALPAFTAGKIWPRIAVINCIKSAATKPYLDVLVKKIGLPGITVRDPGIYASEGRVSLGLTEHDDAGVLVAHENFIELMEQRGEKYGRPVTIDKARKGKKYKVVVTTQEGLYRYDMGDVVEVVGFKGSLPIVRFVQRDNFLNIVGEFCPENQLSAAVEAAAETTGTPAEGYTFIPYTQDLEKRPSYELLFEPSSELSREQAYRLMARVEEELQERVQDYRQMRREFGRLAHLRLSVVEKGSYAALDRERLSRAGQPKPVHVAKDSSFRDRFTIELELHERP